MFWSNQSCDMSREYVGKGLEGGVMLSEISSKQGFA